MNIDHGAIFQQCVYDADNRFVDLTLRPAAVNSRAFTLTMTDTSNDSDMDMIIELYLTEENLKVVIDRLTKVLENEREARRLANEARRLANRDIGVEE